MTFDDITATYVMLLGRWVSWVVRHAQLVTMAACVLTIISAVYFIDNLAINTNTSDMLSGELSFRQKSAEIDKAFPQTDSTLVVVIDEPDSTSEWGGAKECDEDDNVVEVDLSDFCP